MTTDGQVDLQSLEERVTARFYEKTADLWQLPAELVTATFGGPVELSAVDDKPPARPTLQFPREQWVMYPNRRIISLMFVDRMLDRWDELTPEQQGQVGYLLAYGGRERVA